MTIAQSSMTARRRPLRLWPGVAIAALMLFFRLVLPRVGPETLFGMPTMYIGVLAPLAGTLLIVLWWLFFSRAPWAERLGAVALMVVALVGTRQFLLHESIVGGAMGMLYAVMALPILGVAFVAWAVATRRLADGPRRATMAATILLACGGWALIRTGGFDGDMDNDFAWRWSPTPEERLLATDRDEPPPLRPAVPATTPQVAPAAQADEPAAIPSRPAAAEAPAVQAVAPVADEPVALPAAPETAATSADWPGFRGPRRDGIVRGVRIASDWSASPPVELWRRPIGPGWSSFAVRGDFVYTQEQRGEDEVVTCYRLATGEPVWRHRDPTRFWESNAGAGPRGTPTLSNGRVYSLGATGILNALDADDGAVVWSRNLASDAHKEVPDWGFSSSPLVVGDLVIVAAAGKLAAYDLATGEPRWFGPDGRSGYSSPQLLTIDGVAQVLLMSGAGATSVSPVDGKVLWEHALPAGARIVQPAQTADGDVLVADGDYGDGNHMRRLGVARGASGWTSEERWVSMGLKPNFNDFVVHRAHAFGFDGRILSCIDLANGNRKWKGGHYGHGQLVLLPDQDLLLVLSEEGELALVGAKADQFVELARLPALEGKTWNHPALVGNVLLVRNGEEMAAFRLALADGGAPRQGSPPPPSQAKSN